MSKEWRLELFFKTEAELRAKVIPFLKSTAVQRINLTNKVCQQHGGGVLVFPKLLRQHNFLATR